MTDSSHSVEVLLPLYDPAGAPFPRSLYDDVRRELTDAFGGVTAFVRSPAEGLWKEQSGAVVRDEIVLFEVMTASLDPAWWASYREDLRARFRQDELIVRATEIRLL